MVSQTYFRDGNKRKIMIIRRERKIRDNKSNKLIDGKRAENCCEKMCHLMPLNRCTFRSSTRNYRDIYRLSVANIVWYNRINDYNTSILRCSQPITHKFPWYINLPDFFIPYTYHKIQFMSSTKMLLIKWYIILSYDIVNNN